MKHKNIAKKGKLLGPRQSKPQPAGGKEPQQQSAAAQPACCFCSQLPQHAAILQAMISTCMLARRCAEKREAAIIQESNQRHRTLVAQGK
jgi:hypothetical protein